MFLVLKPHGGAPTGCIGNDKPVPEPEPPWGCTAQSAEAVSVDTPLQYENLKKDFCNASPETAESSISHEVSRRNPRRHR